LGKEVEAVLGAFGLVVASMAHTTHCEPKQLANVVISPGSRTAALLTKYGEGSTEEQSRESEISMEMEPIMMVARHTGDFISARQEKLVSIGER